MKVVWYEHDYIFTGAMHWVVFSGRLIWSVG